MVKINVDETLHSSIVSYSCVESLFAAVSLHIVDDGSMKRRGATYPSRTDKYKCTNVQVYNCTRVQVYKFLPPRADQDYTDPDLLQCLHHLLVEHDCQVDAIDLWIVIPLLAVPFLKEN